MFQRQSSDQYGFTLGKRIEDGLLCAEVAIEHHQEFNLELWMISMDMRKAFDTIDHKAMLRALRSRGLPEEYIYIVDINPIWKSTRIGESQFGIPCATRSEAKIYFKRNYFHLHFGYRV